VPSAEESAPRVPVPSLTLPTGATRHTRAAKALPRREDRRARHRAGWQSLHAHSVANSRHLPDESSIATHKLRPPSAQLRRRQHDDRGRARRAARSLDRGSVCGTEAHANRGVVLSRSPLDHGRLSGLTPTPRKLARPGRRRPSCLVIASIAPARPAASCACSTCFPHADYVCSQVFE
jgi:hypothetical protein